jgi:hypothetical protein
VPFVGTIWVRKLAGNGVIAAIRGSETKAATTAAAKYLSM